MGRKRFGACGLALVLLAAGLGGDGADAPLADAAEKADRAGVRALLERRVDVNQAQVDGMTALHWAAYRDDLETAKLLVDAGADVKAANRYGVTPALAGLHQRQRGDGRAAARRPAPTRTRRSAAARRP